MSSELLKMLKNFTKTVWKFMPVINYPTSYLQIS